MNLRERARALDVTLALAASKLVLHLATANGYGYFRDEFYYLACGAHLDWGYVDHAPLVALVARVIRVTLGDSRLALRSYPAICGALTVALTGYVAHAMGGRRFAQGAACLGVIVAPYFLLLDHLFTMNCLDPVLWTLALVLVVKAQREPRRSWLIFGLVAGVGLLNKHAMLFVGAAVVLALLLTPQRRQLRTRWPWVALAIAAIAFAPNVVWEMRHGWPTLEFMRNVREGTIVAFSVLGFAKEQWLGMNPLTGPLIAAGLWFTLAAPQGRAWRVVGIVYVALFALFVAMHGKPYYLVPAYPALLAAGGCATERIATSAWARASIAAALLASGVALAPLGLPVLSVPSYQRYARAIAIAPSTGERSKGGELPQIYADMFGWEPMVQKVARAYFALSPDERARAGIYANNWGEAGAIDFFGRRLGLPRAISGHNSYWLWGYQPFSGDVLIIVGGDPASHESVYGDVRRVDQTDEPRARPDEQGLGIFVCRKPNATLGEIWPRVRRYD